MFPGCLHGTRRPGVMAVKPSCPKGRGKAPSETLIFRPLSTKILLHTNKRLIFTAAMARTLLLKMEEKGQKRPISEQSPNFREFSPVVIPYTKQTAISPFTFLFQTKKG